MTPAQLWLLILGAAVLITALFGALGAVAGGWEAREQRQRAKQRHPSARTMPTGIVITCDCGAVLAAAPTWAMALFELELHEEQTHTRKRRVYS